MRTGNFFAQMLGTMSISLDSSFFLLADSSSASVFTYFAQSNFAGKFIIIALAALSLVAWTVMIGKYLDLSRKHSGNEHFSAQLDKTESLLRVDPKRIQPKQSAYAEMVSEGLSAFHASFSQTNHKASISLNQMANALQRGIARHSIQYESKMVLLGSVVTGAPFLGLLGTVWGVMDAFGAITAQSSATLQNLAPGVSGALLTTVAGLIVAIPSVFGYNYLHSQTKHMITELENFASTVADRAELELQESQTEASYS